MIEITLFIIAYACIGVAVGLVFSKYIEAPPDNVPISIDTLKIVTIAYNIFVWPIMIIVFMIMFIIGIINMFRRHK